MKLIYVTEVYKSMFPVKNGTNSLNILYTGSYNSFTIDYGLWEKKF